MSIHPIRSTTPADAERWADAQAVRYLNSSGAITRRDEQPATRLDESFPACNGGPCNGGRAICPTPEACRLPEGSRMGRFMAWISAPGVFWPLYGAVILLVVGTVSALAALGLGGWLARAAQWLAGWLA